MNKVFQLFGQLGSKNKKRSDFSIGFYLTTTMKLLQN